MANVPLIKLSNGRSIPSFGLGTYQGHTVREAEVKQAIKDAIDLGYRLIDCAHIYRTEKIIGDALQDKFKEGVVKREDLFITSKLWNTFHRTDLVEPALKQTLKDLQLEYVDLYLMHWPLAYKEETELSPVDPNTGLIIESHVDFLDTWKEMEKLLKKGLTKSIGISNFNSLQIDRLLKNAEIPPVIHQFEVHPYLSQAKLRKFCSDRNIRVISYSPLGAPGRPWRQPGDREVIDDPRFKELGKKYGKSPAQIMLRYNHQLGNIIIPKSSNKQRIKENLNIFDFELSADDVKYIDTFDCKNRVCPQTRAKHHAFYPFKPEVEF